MDFNLIRIVLTSLFYVTAVLGHETGEHAQENVAKPDKEHIKEHLKEEAEMDTSKMSEEELEFYHFKLHDSDNNTALDGLEVFKAVRHQLEGHGGPTEPPVKSHEEFLERAKRNDDETARNVDQFFKAVDKNDDGYITFVEYKIHMQQLRHPSPPQQH